MQVTYFGVKRTTKFRSTVPTSCHIVLYRAMKLRILLGINQKSRLDIILEKEGIDYETKRSI